MTSGQLPSYLSQMSVQVMDANSGLDTSFCERICSGEIWRCRHLLYLLPPTRAGRGETSPCSSLFQLLVSAELKHMMYFSCWYPPCFEKQQQLQQQQKECFATVIFLRTVLTETT